MSATLVLNFFLQHLHSQFAILCMGQWTYVVLKDCEVKIVSFLKDFLVLTMR